MSNLKNFVQMIVFILRRDRLYLPLWIIAMVALALFFAPMMPSFLGNESSSAILTEMMKNPAMSAMMGKSYGDSMGAMYALFMLVWAAIGMAIFNILLVARHTRKVEELGQSELILALPVGRSANLLAVLKVAFSANLIIAIITAAALPLLNIEGIDLSGAIVFAAALGVVGFSFAALTALLAQLFSTTRSVYIVAFVLLGLFYILRAAGDTNPDMEVLALISPLGIIERSQAWVENLAWPILVLLAASLLVSALAFVFSAMRDNGSGIFPTRDGRRHAGFLLKNEWGLAWRLTGGIFIGWILVMFLLGVSYGTILSDIGSFMESSYLYTAVMGDSDASTSGQMELFVSFILMLMAVIAMIPVCMIVLKLRSEENRGRMEQLLAKSVSRTGTMLAYVVFAIALAVVLLIATPLGMYASAAAAMDSPPGLGVMLTTSLNYLPAMLVFIGLSALLIGLAPKLTAIVWGLLVYCFLIGYIGNLMTQAVEGFTRDLFEAMTNISPFSLTPMLPNEEFSIAITILLCAAFAVMLAVGILSYRNRDIKENA